MAIYALTKYQGKSKALEALNFNNPGQVKRRPGTNATK